jgi:predicted DNA-binding transcriptional regulator YafY
VDREVDPLGLVLKGGAWYFVAMVDGQTRTYRASRVVHAEDTGETFQRPAEFDLPAFWADTTAAYERDHPETEVTIRVAPDRRGSVRDLIGNDIVTGIEPLPAPEGDDWSHLRLRMRWPDEALGRLLVLGADFEVLGPPAMRQDMAALARATLERHAAVAGDR